MNHFNLQSNTDSLLRLIFFILRLISTRMNFGITKRAYGKSAVEFSANLSWMFSIKFPGSLIFSMIYFLKVLPCASLKNCKKIHGKIPGSPKYDAKHWAHVYFWLVIFSSNPSCLLLLFGVQNRDVQILLLLEIS